MEGIQPLRADPGSPSSSSPQPALPHSDRPEGRSRDEITRAVEAVANGEVIIGAAVAGAVMTRLMAGSTRLTPFSQLTDREHEVLDLVARGLSNGDIARRLHLSDKTVRNVVSAVLTKLPAETRPQAMAMARDAGMGSTELA